MKPEETTPATIEALIIGKDSDLPAVRAAAKQALPSLVAALQSDRWDPENAAEALGLFGPDAKDAIPALTQALEDDDYSIRREAARALLRIAPAENVVPAFIQLLKHEDPNRATTAAKALASLGPQAKAAVPELVRCLNIEPEYDSSGLNDKYRWLRFAAIEALGQIGTASDEVVLALASQLTHENSSVRRHAAEALSQLDAKAAVPELLQLIIKGDTSAEHLDYRSADSHAAIKALHTIIANEQGEVSSEARSAIPVLIQVVSGSYPNEIRATAASALGRIGPAANDAIPVLTELATTESKHGEAVSLIELRKTAAKVLPLLKPEDAQLN